MIRQKKIFQDNIWGLGVGMFQEDNNTLSISVVI